VPATATITVTAQTVTATVQAYVHETVNSVAITGGPGIGATGPICATSSQCTCTSLSLASGTSPLPQFVATAYSNDPTVCTPKSLSAPCNITSDLTAGTTGVSPFQWSSSDATIATVDTTGTSTAGTVTPIGTGQASIFASAAGINSASVPFVTCPVTSITLTAPSTANGGLGPLDIGPGSTQGLSVAVTDTTGATVTYPTLSSTTLAINFPSLSWLSTDFYALTAAAQTQSSVKTTTNGVTTTQTVPLATGTATGVKNGNASLVTSCTPPGCNKNLFPVYSNPLVTAVAGTTAPTAYIASSQSLTMLAVSPENGQLLATFPLPSKPTSLLFNKQGTKAVFGSPNGVFLFDPVAVTFQTLAFNGDVLSISPDGSMAAVFGQVAGVNQNAIGIINLSQSSLVTTFPITGKPTDSSPTQVAADFSLDSRYLAVAVTPPAGTTSRIYVFTSAVGPAFFTTSSPVNTVAFLASGPLMYLAGDTSTTSITARATCLGGQQNVKSASTVAVANGSDLPNGIVDVQIGTAPSNIRALPSAAGILALDLPSIDVVTLTNPDAPFVGCPPTVSGTIESLSQQNLGLSSLSPPPTGNGLNQFLVTPNSSTAVLTDTNTSSTGSSVTLVSLASLQSLQTTTIPLVNSANLKDPTTGLVFKGDVIGDSTAFVVGASDGFLHTVFISFSADYAFDITGYGLLQADGVTAALPNLVAIRNQ
jgi:hypothetical protein